MKVEAKYLLLIAAAVWLIAGFNILRLGGLAIMEGTTPLWILLVGIPATFLVFHMMFSRLVGKHADRIRSYGENKMHVLKFFDVKGYIVMIFMMTMGISLRAFGIAPTWVVAFFYTGLGAALMLAGVGFIIHYVKRGDDITCPVTKRSRPA